MSWDLVEREWRSMWEIIKASSAYKEGKTLKECKQMLRVLFERAMLNVCEAKERLREIEREKLEKSKREELEIFSSALEVMKNE